MLFGKYYVLREVVSLSRGHIYSSFKHRQRPLAFDHAHSKSTGQSVRRINPPLVRMVEETSLYLSLSLSPSLSF